jgi:hypothetical protein
MPEDASAMGERTTPRSGSVEHAWEMLNGYRTFVSIHCQAHGDLAHRYARFHFWFGIIAIVLSALAGSSVLDAVATDAPWLLPPTAVGVIALFAGGFAAVQTFMGFADRAQSHKSAASLYAAARRKIDAWQVELRQPPVQPSRILEIVREAGASVSEAERDAPSISPKNREDARQALQVDLEMYKKMSELMNEERYRVATA